MNRELIEIIPTLPIIQNPEDINESTKIEKDLKLSGSDARRFLFNYGDKFNVDMSQFKFGKYFSRDVWYYRIFPFFFRRRQLTLGDLEQAIYYKKLNDRVLNEISKKKGKKTPHKKLYLQGQTRYMPEDVLIYILTAIALFILLSFLALWI